MILKDEWNCCVEAWNRWRYVQAVWDKWQTINAGILAITASWIGLNIARAKEERQRVRDLEAARALLPMALSDLCGYFKESARFLNEPWEIGGSGSANDPPKLPEIYQDIFRECIQHAEPEVRKYMSLILRNLQRHAARLRSLEANIDSHTLGVYFFRLAELQVYVNHLFGFARGEATGVPNSFEWEDFRNAYSILDIEYEGVSLDPEKTLESLTRQQITKINSQINN